MKLSDKEALKILAEAIVSSHEKYFDGTRYYCVFCDEEKEEIIKHKSDCPVLLAEEVLKKCPNCMGRGYGYSYNSTITNCVGVMCEYSNGTGVNK